MGNYRQKPALLTADPRLIEYLQRLVVAQTSVALNQQFGVSYNTWRKLIAGKPVRASLMDRLEARIGAPQEQEKVIPGSGIFAIYGE